MAKSKSSVLYCLLLLVTLVSVSTAEGRLGEWIAFGFGSTPPAPALSCDAVYGVQSGDTCFEVSKKFKLSAGFFIEINPNLDCEKLFIGQWLCIMGSA